MHVRNWMRAAGFAAVLGSGPCLAAAQGKSDLAAGKAVYERDCLSCHGPTGKGDGEDAAYYTTKPADFSDKAALSKRSDEFLTTVITQGGPAKGLSKDMPAAKLTPVEVKSVIVYIRSLGTPAKAAK